MEGNLNFYITIVDFLANVLGENSEVVLHDIKNNDLGSSVVYLKNNLTGRKIGAPATDLMMDILREESYKKNDFIHNYRSKSSDGRVFLSSSLFLKDDEGNLIGMICVNTDQSKVYEVGSKIEEVLQHFSQLTSYESAITQNANETVKENLCSTLSSIVEEAIFKVTGSKVVNANKLNKFQKLSIVYFLNKNGFFEFKNAIAELADIFKMSEVSIYKYLKEVKEEDWECTKND